ncbi:MAG: hypothetical protein IPQ02_16240 [Saprospiraceae bacterium]|nr:hypothetical protein [Candidatus Defluviibacterium haderslevense]
MNTLRYSFLLILLMLRLKTFCQNTVPQHLNVKEKIGWIPFDKSLDNSNFKVCDELNIEEYYQVNPSYGEGMPSIRKYISSHQKELEELCEKDGYVISRFVINCQGQTDRYRTKFMSLNYTDENTVNAELQKKIIQLTRNMGNWNPGKYDGKTFDCYQHLKFLFKNSQLVDILF